jgi:hypothetical protein
MLLPRPGRIPALAIKVESAAISAVQAIEAG